MKNPKLLKLMNFWPPFLGAGIKVLSISSDFSEIKAKLKLRFYNRNYVGTAFGGSIYSFVDPFYMLMLIQKLGKGYIVWDKAASIKFIKPGKTDLFATFKIDDEEVERIKNELKSSPKVEPIYTLEIKDKNDELVAIVEKKLYIKKK